jgi:hypothetical protein
VRSIIPGNSGDVAEVDRDLLGATAGADAHDLVTVDRDDLPGEYRPLSTSSKTVGRDRDGTSACAIPPNQQGERECDDLALHACLPKSAAFYRDPRAARYNRDRLGQPGTCVKIQLKHSLKTDTAAAFKSAPSRRTRSPCMDACGSRSRASSARGARRTSSCTSRARCP